MEIDTTKDIRDSSVSGAKSPAIHWDRTTEEVRALICLVKSLTGLDMLTPCNATRGALGEELQAVGARIRREEAFKREHRGSFRPEMLHQYRLREKYESLSHAEPV